MIKGKLGSLFGAGKKLLQKSTLKAVCAGAALVTYADGDVTAEEIKNVVAAVVNSSELSCFTETEIEESLQLFLGQLQRNLEMGKRECYKQVETQLNDTEGGGLVLAVAQSVAKLGGAKEAQVVEEIQRRIRL